MSESGGKWSEVRVIGARGRWRKIERWREVGEEEGGGRRG